MAIDTGMDTIFMQNSFSNASPGTGPIDIRFMPVVSIGAPALLTIDTQAKLNQLFALPGAAASPTVNMFFVDTLDFCSSFSTILVGCANTPGHKMVLESGFAAGNNGDSLGGHELGHNLGLDHVGSNQNLMFDTINSNNTLTTAQVDDIFFAKPPNPPPPTFSPLQFDVSGAYVDILPIFITAVPLPGALPLVLSAVVFLGATGRRRRIVA